MSLNCHLIVVNNNEVSVLLKCHLIVVDNNEVHSKMSFNCR